MGTPARTKKANAQHPVPDAAARRQRRRLHQLPGQRGPRVLPPGRRQRHGHLPRLRLAQLLAQPVRGHGRGQQGRRRRRGRHQLHGRCQRPPAHQVQPRLLRQGTPFDSLPS